ncbi:MAG: helix-turn-helix domain-containing protein [Halobacteria archaeon]|nr:helix-turn-helix domain-containing protein [Halobacteria archaeon]
MRYYQFVLNPPDGFFHSAERQLVGNTAVERESILHLELLSDSTGVVVYRMNGDPTGISEGLDGRPDVVEHDVFDIREDTFHIYARFEPDEPATNLLSVADRYGLVYETPLKFTNDGSLEMVVMGKNEVIQEALPEFIEATEGIDVVLKKVGEYRYGDGAAYRGLTEREAEILNTAVEMGYYETPRQATHSDIAEEVGCTASTVGEHLRKTESKIIQEISDVDYFDTG